MTACFSKREEETTAFEEALNDQSWQYQKP
jgi:hypothetical protein